MGVGCRVRAGRGCRVLGFWVIRVLFRLLGYLGFVSGFWFLGFGFWVFIQISGLVGYRYTLGCFLILRFIAFFPVEVGL